MTQSILVFDFDGTVALGDGPVCSYARHIVARDSAVSYEDLISDLERPAGALDGYDLVARRARAAGADASTLDAAYLASRAQLATPESPVCAPRGLDVFLAALRGRARRVLATNAPAIRIDEALAALGLADVFDEVLTDVGKPAGMSGYLDGLPAGARVLSIGDIWVNDLAPAHQRGHATALVGTADVPATAAPDHRAAGVADLYEVIEAWVDAAHDLARTPSLPSSPHHP
ncbi:HAD family hydrolase [Microbacterium oryzae]|uniref:HAD family hydrolase n=1 Tax=Microbacterium oryzae TaxID=743009 RepID=UPI001C129BA4|nr:haloacid dehalogenase-like hydrolase [Microbacterium oryzae]